MCNEKAILDIRDLEVCYDSKSPTVRGVSLQVPEGAVVSLIGPNACGKSTVVKAVSRLIPFSAGQVTFDGGSVLDLRRKELARKLAVLLQHNSIPPNLTVRELVAFGRTPFVNLFSRLSDKDEEIVSWAMERAGVTHLSRRMVGELSGGERQKALFAMAIARQPKLLILDEPTTFLDVSHQIELLELARQINRDAGVTVLMVLHDLNQASFYSDQLVLMQDGKIVRDGTPAEVLTEEDLREVYGVEAEVSFSEWGTKPYVKILGLKEKS